MTTATKTPGAPVRWGMVGLGWVAKDFVAPALMASASADIVAWLGSSPAKGHAFAQRFQVPETHHDLRELMQNPNVDAVYITLPNALHREAVLAGAAAGRHMLCEKPFAMSSADAVAMAQGCEKAGVILRIAHQIRLDAALSYAREIVRSGQLGVSFPSRLSALQDWPYAVHGAKTSRRAA